MPSNLRALSPVTWLCLAGFTLAVVGLVHFPAGTAGRELVARGGGLLAALTMLFFVLRLQSNTRSIWLLFWLYQACIVTGDIIYYYPRLTTTELPFPGPADAFYLLSYFFAWGGLVMLARRISPRRNFEVAADSVVIALAILAIVGFVVIAPLISASEKWDLALAISVAYPALDVFVFAALVRLYLLSPVHNAALLALSVSMLSFLLLDLGYYYHLYAVGTELDIDIPWFVTLSLMTVAASLPSAGKIDTQDHPDGDNVSPWRALMVAASVLIPLALAALDHTWRNGSGTLWNLGLGVAAVLLVLWRGYRLLGANQEHHRALKVLAQNEVEARLRAEAGWQAAEAASAAKGQFLSVMSHELRTPLTSIMGMFGLIQGIGAGDKEREFAARGLKSSEHLLQLINDVLDLATIEAGRLKLVSVPFELRALLDEIAEIAKVRRNQRVAFDLNIDPSLIGRKFVGDPTRLKQVLVNLLTNAFKFTDRGTVTLNVHQIGDDSEKPLLEFSVIDTGIGMTLEQQSHLFQPFTQLDMSNTRRAGGTGLGLVISQHLVKLMNGEPIKVESQSGIGSRFAFRLALATAVETPASFDASSAGHQARPAPRLVGCKLLIAEDDEEIRFVIRRMMESEGATVDEVTDGAAAVRGALAATTPYDVILMDIRMPEKDGIAATRELRARGYHHPIIALTANAYGRDRDECADAGMNDFATKPVKIDELVEKIKRHQLG